MATIKEAALSYEGQSTANIADLEKVSTGLKIEGREGKNKDDEVFTYNVIVQDGQEYRIPNSVLASLRAIMEEAPDLKFFKVRKKGTGFDTTYTVIPLV